MICPKCRKDNVPGAKFCGACSTSLEIVAPPVSPAVAEPGTSAPAAGSGMQQQFQKAQASEGVKIGDVGMMKDSVINNTTNISSHDTHGAPAVGGSQTINIQSGGMSEVVLAEMMRQQAERERGQKRVTVVGEKCPICGALVKDDYFSCGVCNKDFICNRHQHQHQHEYMCVKCAHGRGLFSEEFHTKQQSAAASAAPQQSGHSVGMNKFEVNILHQAPAAPPPAASQAPASAAAVHSAPASAPTKPPPPQNSASGAMIGIAVAAVVVLGVGGFMATRTSTQPPTAGTTSNLGISATTGAVNVAVIPAATATVASSSQSATSSRTPMASPAPVSTPAPGLVVSPPPPPSDAPLEIKVNFVGQRETGPNTYQPIDIREGATLRSNDNFKILVSASRECYLYVINFDSLGKANLLFPGMAGSNNKVASGSENQIPDGDNWLFLDNNTGTEAFYVIADVRPMSDLQGLIAEMERQGGRDTSSQILAQVRTRGVAVKQVAQGSTRTFRTGDGETIKNVTQVVRGTGSLVWSLSFKHI